MGKLLSVVLFIPPLLAWNAIRTLLTHSGFENAFHDGGSDFRAATLRHLALRLQATGVTEDEFVFGSLLAGLFFAFVGFFFDALLGGRGFGPSGNGALLFFGACVTSAFWLTLAPAAIMADGSSFVMIAALGAAATLIAAAFLKALIHARFSAAADRLHAPLSRREERIRAASQIRRGAPGRG